LSSENLLEVKPTLGMRSNQQALESYHKILDADPINEQQQEIQRQ